MSEFNREFVRTAMLDAFAHGVAEVEGERVARRWLTRHPRQGEVAVIALGKAAGAMALGAQRALGPQLARGLVVTKAGHADAVALDAGRFIICEGSHPIPDASSLSAGHKLMQFVAGLPKDMPVVVLISGGASALVEVLREGVDLAGLARVNSWLLANGRPIEQINAVRRRLSQLKGGGLGALLAPREIVGLLISDVEGDDPAVIGSGPLTPPASRELPEGLPEWLLAMLPAVDETPPPATEVVVVATLDHALAAAEKTLSDRGLVVKRYADHLLGDLADVDRSIAEALREAPGLVHLWGGEVTLMLPDNPGRGGRNQHLALSLAGRIAGQHAAVALSAGTDGTDGPTGDAGGLVDNETLDRAKNEGLELDDHLSRADSGSLLEQTGDLVSTGPTGTNVCDLIMAWRA